jgi:hypothetical protein
MLSAIILSLSIVTSAPLPVAPSSGTDLIRTSPDARGVSSPYLNLPPPATPVSKQAGSTSKIVDLKAPVADQLSSRAALSSQIKPTAIEPTAQARAEEPPPAAEPPALERADEVVAKRSRVNMRGISSDHIAVGDITSDDDITVSHMPAGKNAPGAKSNEMDGNKAEETTITGMRRVRMNGAITRTEKILIVIFFTLASLVVGVSLYYLNKRSQTSVSADASSSDLEIATPGGFGKKVGAIQINPLKALQDRDAKSVSPQPLTSVGVPVTPPLRPSAGGVALSSKFPKLDGLYG